MSYNWKPIIVGVDGSPESVQAASFAALAAQRAGTTCVPIAAVPDYARLLFGQGVAIDGTDMVRHAIDRDRTRITAALSGHVPDTVSAALEVRAGDAVRALVDAALVHGAGLIVVGHRPHRGLDRLRARIVRHLLRVSDVPLLVVNGWPLVIGRVLAALDLSSASRSTFEAALAWARAFDARLRVMHVVEPPPPLLDPAIGWAAQIDQADAGLQRTGVWSLIDDAEAEKVVRAGHAATTIATEVQQWSADLLVLGSHGHNWVDRLVVGSTTEQLTYHPAVLTLIVPTASLKLTAPNVRRQHGSAKSRTTAA